MNESEFVNLTLVELLWHSTVRIEYNNAYHGTGFFVTPEYVVTCAHVVKGEGETVKLKLCDGKLFEAIVIKWHSTKIKSYPDDKFPDLALLKITDGQHNNCYVELNPEVKAGDTLSSYGFTGDFSNGYSLTTSYVGSLPIEGYELTDFMEVKEGLVKEGFSGSALLNNSTGAICGLMKYSIDKTLLPIGGHGVSASLIRHYFKEQLETAQSSAQIKKTPWGVLRLLSKAANNGNANEPVTLASFINHWTNWSSKELDKLDASGFLTRNVQVTSPLESHWQDFVQAPHWRTEVAKRLELLF